MDQESVEAVFYDGSNSKSKKGSEAAGETLDIVLAFQEVNVFLIFESRPCNLVFFLISCSRRALL